jgi:16S rRNA (guanine(1405)-N(7))-methyltransferase
MKDLDSVFKSIISAKKYNNICDSLIHRICTETYVKYKKEKEITKAIKSQLHSIYGAFYSDNCINDAKVLIDMTDPDSDLKVLSNQLLQLHVSSKERLLFREPFYRFIFSVIGSISTITDIGCGFHPFSLPFNETVRLTNYYAFDIDKRLPKLLNSFFHLHGLPEAADTIDIISEVPSYSSDVVFLFKLLPVIEQQKKGKSVAVIEQLNTNYVILTFPTRSISGKVIGMIEHYSDFIAKNLAPQFNIVAQELIGNELVCIIKK